MIKADYIRDRLSYIKAKVEDDSKQYLYDINKSAEDIFMHILNATYGYDLKNANDIKPNFPTIDLLDTTNTIAIQVTSDTSKKKVKTDTVEAFKELVKQDEFKEYSGYTIKMFYIKNKPSNATLKNWERKDEKFISQSNILGIEDINTKVSANPTIATKVFKTLCEIFHDKVCDSDVSSQLTSKLGKDTIIGREKELQEIDTLLKKSSSLLLINGIGGIGKSTIASYYLHSQKDKLDYYGFFEGLDSFTSELRTNLALQQEKEDDAFMEALSRLRNLKGNKLLVFDDIKDIKENQDKIEKILALKDSGYRILLTSREEIEDIEQYYLEVLSLSDAKELFNSIYPVEDEVLLEEILGYLDCHAFFVDMTAKTLKSKKTLTPKIIKEKFENGEFSSIKRKRKESFNEYLNELFSFDELDEEEILMLKQLSALPSIEIEFKFLQEIMDKEDDEEFEDILNYLCEKGWLGSFENGYKLHQIVKEFILLPENFPCFEEIEKIVDFFTNIMQGIHTLEDTLLKKRYLGFLESILFVLKDRKSEKIAYFLHATGYLSFVLGNYKKAEELYKQSSAIREKILDENDIQLSISINNEASIYEHNGDYKKALELYLKSLKIRVQYFGIYPDKVAIVYNNIGRMYEKIDDYDKAWDYLHESLNMRIEIFGEKNEATARAYNVLGSFLRDKSKRALNKEELNEIYKKAYEYAIKALDIRKEILSKNHPDIAISFINLGMMYGDMRKYDMAIDYFEFALNIYKNGVGDNSNSMALVYSNIGTIFWEKEKFEEAIEFKEKAYKLWLNILDVQHPNLLNIEKEIEMMKGF